MKKAKIIISFITAIILCSQLFFVSFASSTTIYFSKNEVEEGDTVTVTVKFSGDDIAGIQFDLGYDTDVLSVQDSSGGSYSNGRFTWYDPNGSVSEHSFSVTFKATNSGSSQISASNVIVSDNNAKKISDFSGASAKLTVVGAQDEKPTEKATESKQDSADKKQEEKTTEKVTEEKNETDGKTVMFNGNEYYFAEDSAFVDAPEGFDETYSDYKGTRILTYTSTDKSQQIVCLVDENGKQTFALFDDESDTFSPFITVKSKEISLVILKPGADILPDGFTIAKAEIGENEVTVFENEQFKKENLCLVYALNAKGEAGLYIYDRQAGTFVKYIGFNTTLPEEESSEAPVEETVEPKQEEKTTSKQSLLIKVICVLAVLLAAALIAVITLIIKFRKREKAVMEENSFTFDKDSRN